MQSNKQSKNIVRILLIILLVSSIAAVGVGIAQVLPGYSDKNMVAYSAEWTLPVSAGDEIDVKVSTADIVISQHEGSKVEAHFEGKRRPNRSGDLPEIFASCENGVLTIKERRYEQKKINIGIEDHDRIQGTLTIKLPSVIFGDVRIEGYSGSITAEALCAGVIQIDTVSGSIAASCITATGSATFSGFSGIITADQIVSPSLTLDTSSGHISASNLTVEQDLSVESFSGKQDFQQISAGNALVSSSSGNVAISGMTARALDVETFSGHVRIEQSDIQNAANLETASGIVTLTAFDASRLSIDTFSGDISMQDIKTAELQANTSSGDFSASLLGGCPITAETFSGHINLTVPSSVGFTYKIDTFSGDVNIAFPQITINSNDSAKSAGKIGDGTYLFDLTTGSGDISIQP